MISPRNARYMKMDAPQRSVLQILIKALKVHGAVGNEHRVQIAVAQSGFIFTNHSLKDSLSFSPDICGICRRQLYFVHNRRK